MIWKDSAYCKILHDKTAPDSSSAGEQTSVTNALIFFLNFMNIFFKFFIAFS